MWCCMLVGFYQRSLPRLCAGGSIRLADPHSRLAPRGSTPWSPWPISGVHQNIRSSAVERVVGRNQYEGMVWTRRFRVLTSKEYHDPVARQCIYISKDTLSSECPSNPSDDLLQIESKPKLVSLSSLLEECGALLYSGGKLFHLSRMIHGSEAVQFADQ